jgi:hypothetical protein
MAWAVLAAAASVPPCSDGSTTALLPWNALSTPNPNPMGCAKGTDTHVKSLVAISRALAAAAPFATSAASAAARVVEK